MSRRAPRLVAVALAVTAGLTVAGSSEAARQWTETGQPVPELAAVDTMVRNLMTGHDIRNATVAITKDGRLVFARGYTWDEPARGEPVQPTALFRAASISKSVTSVAIHQLIDRGLLTYNTRVTEILDLRPPSGKRADPWLDLVTVDHLLTHTGGWDREAGGRFFDPLVFQDHTIAAALGVPSPPTRAEIATFMTGRAMDFKPGTDWAYSNYGYMLLGMIVEELTGQSYAEYVLGNVFRPVGVSRPRIAHSTRSEAAPGEVEYHCATTSFGCANGNPYDLNYENVSAAGGWAFAAPDIARLYSALFDADDASGLLSRTSRASMIEASPVLGANGYCRGWLNESYLLWYRHTLGWLTNWLDGYAVIGHSGSTPGTHTLAVWRSDGIVFVIMTNKDAQVSSLDFPSISSWPTHDLWPSVGIVEGHAGSPATEAWVPVVARTTGVGDSVWRSNLALLNRSTLDNKVRLRPVGQPGSEDLELTLAPGELRAIDDIGAQLGLTGSAPLRVFSSEGLGIASRTSSQTPSGTLGQSLAAYPAGAALRGGESAVLMHLREDDAFRSNVGLVNTGKRAAQVRISLFDGSGTPVATAERSIGPESAVQLDRPFSTVGHRSDLVSGYGVVEVLKGESLLAYGSVVDNGTLDPTTMAMKTGIGSASHWVAAAAHGDGSAGSRWRSDLAVLNRSGQPRAVDIQLHDGTRSGPSMSIILGNGEQRVLEDVVAHLGASGSWAIAISADGPVLVSSRTYNLSAAGTSGQLLEGYPEHRALIADESAWLVGLRQSPSFRSNIGLLNSGGSDVRVRLRLFDGDGTELASWLEQLSPGERRQLQEPLLTKAGRHDVGAGYARISVESGAGRVVAYGSVIDNRSNDPTTIELQR